MNELTTPVYVLSFRNAFCNLNMNMCRSHHFHSLNYHKTMLSMSWYEGRHIMIMQATVFDSIAANRRFYAEKRTGFFFFR